MSLAGCSGRGRWPQPLRWVLRGATGVFCLLPGFAVLFAQAAACAPLILLSGNIQPLSRPIPAKAAFCFFDHASYARELMNSFNVDTELCRKDGICAKVCPIQIIDGKVGEYPSMSSHKARVCIGCGQCMAFCPANACSAPGLSSRDSRPLQPEQRPSAEQVEELVFSRRSVRNFKSGPVPRELLRRILEAARFAPTAKNTQELRWIVLEAREQTEKLAAMVIDWLRALPEIDPATAKDVHAESLVRAWEAGHDVITRTAPQIVLIVAPKGHWGPADASIAAAYLELLAHAHKVGCCWGGYVCFAAGHPSAHALRAYLGVNEDEQVYAAQMIGFPLLAPHFRPPRKVLDVTWL